MSPATDRGPERIGRRLLERLEGEALSVFLDFEGGFEIVNRRNVQ